MANDLLRHPTSTVEMLAIFDDAALIAAMLEFECALAQTQAELSVIPQHAATTIASMCDVELYDFESLATRALPAGTLAIPLVQDLTRKVTELDPPAGGWVHFGATSQDILDTALVLQLRSAIRLVKRDLDALVDALSILVEAHATAVMLGRTLMQPATPITLSLKATGWRDAIERSRTRILAAGAEALNLQLGGATGTLAAMGTSGRAVRTTLAARLDLSTTEEAWHAHRDRLVALTSAAAILVGSLGKMARDISLLMQGEVGEAFEPEAAGRGGSSAMPHKRNPVGCMTALAAATRVPGLLSSHLSAMVQEHERALGGWQAEWVIIPAIFEATAGALAAMREVIEGLRIEPLAMRRNLDTVGALVLSERLSLRLARDYDRGTAAQLVKEACARSTSENRPLAEVLAQDERISMHVSLEEIADLLDPATYLGTATPEKRQ